MEESSARKEHTVGGKLPVVKLHDAGRMQMNGGSRKQLVHDVCTITPGAEQKSWNSKFRRIFLM